MKKAIIKAKLGNHNDFTKKLSDIELNFAPVYWQHDRVYVPKNYKPKSNFPRLVMRTEMKAVDKPAKYFFILRRHIEDSGVDIIEKTEIKDYEKMVAIIHQLGFKLAKEVSRRRQELKMDENNFIFLDKIDHLPGYYAKIESNLDPNDSTVEAIQDLKKTLQTLGESNFIESAYFEI